MSDFCSQTVSAHVYRLRQTVLALPCSQHVPTCITFYHTESCMAYQLVKLCKDTTSDLLIDIVRYL